MTAFSWGQYIFLSMATETLRVHFSEKDVEGCYSTNYCKLSLLKISPLAWTFQKWSVELQLTSSDRKPSMTSLDLSLISLLWLKSPRYWKLSKTSGMSEWYLYIVLLNLQSKKSFWLWHCECRTQGIYSKQHKHCATANLYCCGDVISSFLTKNIRQDFHVISLYSLFCCKQIIRVGFWWPKV